MTGDVIEDLEHRDQRRPAAASAAALVWRFALFGSHRGCFGDRPNYVAYDVAESAARNGVEFFVLQNSVFQGSLFLL
jgi:hypothetical protein